jgi:hypothetical protein
MCIVEQPVHFGDGKKILTGTARMWRHYARHCEFAGKIDKTLFDVCQFELVRREPAEDVPTHNIDPGFGGAVTAAHTIESESERERRGTWNAWPSVRAQR